MANLPISPNLKYYRGSKPELQRKASEENVACIRAAEHLNRLIANNPAEVQQYYFADIARKVGATIEQVRSAISDGGYNGITLGVRGADREKLARYRDVNLA